MDKQYQAEKIEEKIYDLWEKGGFFNPDKHKAKLKKSFSIVLPPPNITGSLHIGHALNATIQDIIIRWKRMSGFKTLWVPGIDHAGIATQNVVEKKLKKEGKTRFDLGRENFVKEVWKWKKEKGDTILKQLRKMGVSCDWSRTTFTMDDHYIEAVKQAFLHYYNKGMIYRGERPVNWCPRCQTSLSDLEVEYKEEKSKLWYLKYPFKEDKTKFVVVATTRPETMLGDTAVAVNPRDKRYKDKIGKTLILPIIKREIPIITDQAIDPKFGTGAIKVTPAHDFVDYQISQRNNLEMVKVIDEKGEIEGVPVQETRKNILEKLEKLGLIEKTEDYIHKVPQCYRCGTVLEIIPSKQWFLKMDKLAKLAIKPVKKGEIKFHPNKWEKPYFEWLEKTLDWCISRQLWWGHRLPVWQCQNQKEKYFASLDKPKKCSICGKCQPKQSEDVLDTWFSSALWPFAVFGWPQKTKHLKIFYPTDVLSTARDIINSWVARMVFSSQEFNKKNPFQNIIIHPTVLTKDGRRMSKSLGTGVDPLDLIDKYGADAVRFGLAWEITGLQDIRFTEDNIIAGKKFCNKLWNASRFVTFQLGRKKFDDKKKPKSITAQDKKILKDFEKLVHSNTDNLNQFRFAKAIQNTYHFFWHNFCDIYIEKSKIQIKEANSEKEADNTRQILVYVLINSLKMLHPFIPFVTEEIYQNFPLKQKKTLIIEDWPCYNRR